MRLGVQKKDKGEGEYARVKMVQMEVSVTNNFKFILDLR